MELAKRDLYILQMKTILQEKRKFLLDKYKDLSSTQKENKFLIDVVEDYIKYLKYIKEQKYQQYEALRIIAEYVERISNDTNITEELLKKSRIDQSIIFQVKKELDEITEQI
jgi:hypothetical protein